MVFKFSAEILAGYLYFTMGITNGVIKSVWLESYCWLIPNVTAANCSDPISYEIVREVRPQLLRDFFYNDCIETILPAIMVIFIGPCTDIFGKRPVLFASISGYFLSYILWFIFSFNFKYWNPLIYLITAVPIGLTGGTATFYVVIFCFIIDSEDNLKHVYRFARVEAARYFGLLISQLFDEEMRRVEHGYLITFFVSSLICFLLLIGVYIFIPPELPIRRMELFSVRSSSNPQLQQDESNQQNQGIQERQDSGFEFKWSHELNIFKPVFRSRPEKMRGFLLFIVMTVIMYLIALNGDDSILVKNIEYRFAWSSKQFFIFSIVRYFWAGIAVLICSWLILHVLKYQEPTALLIATIPQMIASFMYTYANQANLVYTGMYFSCVSTLIIPFYMSIVSQIISRLEFARVISFIMSVSSLAAVCGHIIYALMYKKLMTDYFPGSVFLVSCAFSVLCTIFSVASCLASYGPYQNLVIISPPREATSPL